MIDSVWRRYVGTVRPMDTPRHREAPRPINGSGGGMAESARGRTPLISLDAKTRHALEVHDVAGHNRVASVAQGDGRSEQVSEADRLPPASDRPRDPGGTDRTPPFERKDVHLVQEVLDPLLLCDAAGVPE